MVNDLSSIIGVQDPWSIQPGKSDLGKNDFLKLMMEQMKYQDPLDPMDATKFTSQLAEFSTVEQLANMSEQLENSVNANYQLIQSVNNTMTATLIGMEVKVGGENITYNGQEDVSIGYNLPSDASEVTIKIYDDENNLVRTIENLPNTDGNHKYNWDFTDNQGNNLAHGNYRFEVTATAMNGEDQLTVDAYQVGIIDSLKFGEYGAVLTVNGNEVLLENILEILNPSNDTTSRASLKELTDILNGGISG